MNKRIMLDELQVAEFKRTWPCSGLGTGPYWFEFAANGDLVDTNISEQEDGPAALALSQNAQAMVTP